MDVPKETSGDNDDEVHPLGVDNADTDNTVPANEGRNRSIVISDPKLRAAYRMEETKLELFREINQMTPEALEVFKKAIKNENVNNRNFMQWARDQLPNMNHVAQNVIAISAYLAFMHYFYVVTPEAQPSLLLSILGSFPFHLDVAKTSAPANGGSVVDAVFAKAERKAATR